MVTLRFASLLFAALLLASCTDAKDADTAEEPKAGQPVVSASDAAEAMDGAAVEESNEEIGKFGLNVKKGDVFQYRVKQYSENDQDSVRAITNGEHVYTLRVKSVRSDGSVEFGMKFDTVSISVDVRRKPSNEVAMQNRFHSGDSSDMKDPKNVQFKALIGEEATVLVSAKGEVQEISGLTPIVNKIVAGAPPEQRPNEQMKTRIRQQMESSMFASFIGQQFVPYPDGPLDSTRSWTREQESPVANLFMVNSTTNYRITSVKKVKGHRIASVAADFDGNIALVEAPKDATTKLKLNRSKITGTSQAVLDLDNGMTVHKENKIVMDVVATATAMDFERSTALAQKQDTRFEITLLR